MKFAVENEYLSVTVDEEGAELVSVVHKKSGREMLWQGNPSIWDRQAPLLFPHCGALKDDILLAKGREYPAPRHGFARNMPFVCVQEDSRLVFTLKSGEKTKKYFPYEFTLQVVYTLEKETLLQTVLVENPGQQDGGALPFTVGFHPGFALPLVKGGKTADCQFAFDRAESPEVIETPDGYVSGATHTLFEASDTLPLSDDMFANDSICMRNLQSEWLSLVEKNKTDGSGVRVRIKGFPYVLVWGPPEGPLPFVCIEPWHSLPDRVDAVGDFEAKPGLTLLATAEKYETTLEMQFLG